MPKINEKQLKFCEAYVANGYKRKEAYQTAYEQEDGDSANSSAYDLLRQPKIIEKIKEIEGNYKIISMEQGIDKKKIIQKIDDMLNATKKIFKDGELIDESPDHSAVNNGVNTWAKLTGEFEAEKKAIVFSEESEIEKDPSKMTDDELKERKDKILKEL